MSKLAALAPFALPIGLGLSAASTLGNYAVQRETQKANETAQRQWLNYQRQKTQEAEALEDQKRGEALGRWQENLQGQDVQSRQALVDEEAARLTEDFGATEPALLQAQGDAILSGQDGGSADFTTMLGDRLSEATNTARERIKALAKASAYGDSFGGMGTTEALNFQDTGQDLGFINQQRAGNTAVLRKHQQVEPETFSAETSPLGEILAGTGQLLTMYGAGNPLSAAGGAGAAGAGTQGGWPMIGGRIAGAGKLG